ncbi:MULTISPECIES: hypothetical protein [Actinomadura]|uniref:Uncharacterized protein n=1 Tax=Actinomadura yumaensis TaxID=111807 RepID=A0ABW2CIH6_9ACTN|nr:hypothetical protein [Actinomadura sp. J1-007]MWK34856.1 hypothetical protein [Actinomadura sp. J1-007]
MTTPGPGAAPPSRPDRPDRPAVDLAKGGGPSRAHGSLRPDGRDAARRAPAAEAGPGASGPAWLVVPARVIAFVVVVPFRLVYDLVMAGARAIDAGARWIGRLLYAWLLRPPARGLAWLGRAVARLFLAIGRGVAGLLDLLVVRPVRWLAVVVVWGVLRLFGRGTGRLGSWIRRVLLAPIGRFFAAIGGAIAMGFGAVLAFVGRTLELLLVNPLSWLLRNTALVLRAVLTAIGTGLAWLLGVLIVLPAVLLWRYVLWPPLRGIAWICTRIGHGIARAAVALGAAFMWAWRAVAAVLRFLARILFVLPAVVIWRYFLAPILRGIAEGGRLAGRFLRWLWNVLVMAPARWTKANVLRPIGLGVRRTWQVSVRDPLRWTNHNLIAPVRQTARDVRLQLRRAFRG